MMRKQTLSIASTVVMMMFVSAGALAATSDQDDAFDHAVKAIGARDYNRAAALLEQLTSDDPQDVESWTLLGLTWNRLGLHDRALEALERARGLGADNATLDHEIAVARAGAGQRDQITPSPLAAVPRKWLTGSFETGFRYDDNVPLVPDGAFAVAPSLADQSDFHWFNTLQLHSDLYRDADTILGVTGVVSTSFHFDLEDFDTVDLLGVAEVSRRINDRLQLRIAGGGGYSWLDDKPWRATGLLGVAASWDINQRWRLSGSYRFEYVNFLGNVIVPVEDRDGAYHTFRIGPSVHFDDPAVTISAQAMFDIAATDGSSMAYHACGVDTRLTWRPHADWMVAIGGRYRDLQYDHDNIRTALTYAREDQPWSAFASIEWRFRPNWTLCTTFAYLNNDSNIPAFFEYDQTTVGMSIRIDF